MAGLSAGDSILDAESVSGLDEYNVLDGRSEWTIDLDRGFGKEERFRSTAGSSRRGIVTR